MTGHFNDRWGLHRTDAFEHALWAYNKMVHLAVDLVVLTTISGDEAYERIEECCRELADRLGVPQRRVETMMLDADLHPTPPVSGPAEGAGG